MISVKCGNCAGELSIDSQGELICPYCGSKTHFSDLELQDYKTMRLNILNALRSMHDSEMDAADDMSVWNNVENVTYNAENGNLININYSFTYVEDGVVTYITKDSVIHVFDKANRDKAKLMMSGINMLEYPSAAAKDLSRCFPTIKAEIELKDGGVLYAFNKPENAYPLFAFGNLKPVHVAWIISRMENFCCVFEYSEVIHGGITTNSVFINPKTHEAFLYGGWWNTKRKYSSDSTDLKALRIVAKKVTGRFIESAPKEYQAFLNGSPSGMDAYDDFGAWDRVIEEGFGGHRFTIFEQD